MAPTTSEPTQVTGTMSSPTLPQETFSSQFNLDDPEQARKLYMKTMHEHTQQQFQMATATSRRRNSPAEHDIASLPLSSSQSSRGSISQSE